MVEQLEKMLRNGENEGETIECTLQVWVNAGSATWIFS